jgi:hypothetical protein
MAFREKNYALDWYNSLVTKGHPVLGSGLRRKTVIQSNDAHFNQVSAFYESWCKCCFCDIVNSSVISSLVVKSIIEL